MSNGSSGSGVVAGLPVFASTRRRTRSGRRRANIWAKKPPKDEPGTSTWRTPSVNPSASPAMPAPAG